MNVRTNKHRVLSLMMVNAVRIPSSYAPSPETVGIVAGELVQLFREAAGITAREQEADKVDALLATIFDVVPGLVSLRRKKDGVVTHINLNAGEAAEIIAAAKKAKKASLEIA